MFETLRTYVKSLLLEQEERDEQSEEQEIDSIKELFQHWIDEYEVSYLARMKEVYPDSWIPMQMSVKELNDFIFISPNFEKHSRDDWYIIVYNIKNKSIHCANIQALTITPPYAFDYYIGRGYTNKISVDQFRRAMDVTKGNYAQFEVLTKRLSDANMRNAND